MDQSKILEHKISKKLIKKFVRKCPRKEEYLNRLLIELDLIILKRFHKHLLLVVKILDLIKDIPHIIRGSSGSSLVCYCLGITNIDPVKEKIIFSRFLNDKRETMPDIDMDFPYNRREEVFNRMNKKWPNKVGRISNHIYFKEKSALRQAIRDSGYNKFISKYDCKAENFAEKDEILKRQEELMGDFRCYSLHCGGIVFYKDGIPDKARLETKTLNQLKYNKDDVEDKGLFKVDILSNRGLAVLLDVSTKKIEDYPENDPAIVELFSKGKNIGLTFAESPAMRKILSVIKPKNIQDLALCLALVRPAAGGGHEKGKTDVLVKAAQGHFTNFIIYDDDAISYIKNLVNCSEGQADQFRKAFAKNKIKKIEFFKKMIDTFKYNDEGKEKICDSLSSLRKYSFCKSHSLSYAKLVWALAYQKINNPKKFWLSALNHCNSSYRKWVYFNEAKSAGIKLTLGRRPWTLADNKLVQIDKGMDKITDFFKVTKISSKKKSDCYNEYRNYGYWTSSKFLPDMYLIKQDVEKKKNKIGIKVKFKGLIATGKCYSGTHSFKNNNKTFLKGNIEEKKEKVKNTTFITIGYDNGKFIDCVLYGKYNYGMYDVIEGEGYLKNYLDWYNKEKIQNYEYEDYLKTIDLDSNALTIDVSNINFSKIY
ncbi:Bacterial DNA polymerase III alpha subunit [seawater metagenome]|uniref:Bacterial DNA polymerase III alpha subunit n=1 Tax=seawater metagenome TaxID=1561972 RepID=A0A5E8CLJ9_9ZZZZ